MKKTISILLAVMLIAVLLVLPASAATETMADVDILIGFSAKPSGAASAKLSSASTEAEIQAVLDNATSNSVILFNSGTYSMSLSVPADKTLTLLGANWAAAGVGSRSAETVITGGISVAADTGSTAYNVTVKGFTFDGAGLFIGEKARVTVENNRFVYVTSNFSVKSALYVDCRDDNKGDVSIKGNYFRNISGDERSAITALNPYALTIDGNVMEQIEGSGVVIRTTSAWDANPGAVKIINNVIEDWDSNNNGGRAVNIDFTGEGSLSKPTSTLEMTGNAFSRVIASAPADRDFISVDGIGTANMDFTKNYWNSASPALDTIISVESNISADAKAYSVYPHYRTARMDELYAPAMNVTDSKNIKYYATIQAAIDAAATGDTIRVASGTYDEAITIIKAVKLYGPNMAVNPNSSDWSPAARRDEALLTGGINFSGYSGSSLASSQLQIMGFTFDGKGITYRTPSSSSAIINNLTIENNIFKGISGSAIDISNNAAHTIKNLSVVSNRIDGVTGGGAISADYVSGAGEITGNYIRNVGGSAIAFAGQLSGSMTIDKNRMENWGGSVCALNIGTVASSASLKLEYNMFKTSGDVNAQHGHYFISTKSSNSNVTINRNYWGGAGPQAGRGSAALVCTSFYLDELLKNLNGYKVTIPTGAGYTIGVVPGYDASCVEHGGSFKFILTLGSGYATSTPVVKRGSSTRTPSSDGVYTISNITADITNLTVTGIKANKVKVIFDQPEHGKITVNLNASTIVTSGSSIDADTKITIKAEPEEGYVLKYLEVNGRDIASGSTYTVSGSEVEITAKFEIGNTHKITIIGGVGGVLSESTKSVPSGSSLTVKITPNSGYETAKVLVDGKDIGVVGSYAFSNINGDHTLYVTFSAAAAAKLSDFNDVPADAWYRTELASIINMKLFKGMSANEFAPNGTMTRAMFVTVLWRLDGAPAPAPAHRFADVPDGTWYSNAVAWAAANEIISGYSATEFAPNDEVTREQIALMFYKYARHCGELTNVAADITGFPDYANVNSWSNTAMKWAVGTGLIKGRDNGRLDPLASASRCEVAVIFNRYIYNV